MKVIFPNFPNSFIDPFLKTSERTGSYNCIAWAFGDNTKWYWPDPGNNYFWPDDIPREETIENFILLFKKIGYEICNNPNVEPGYEKIVIYQNALGIPTHAARQLNNGHWTSKLGREIDVSHSLFSMRDGAYGNATVIMKRIKV